jgi:hypothetical protein
MVVNKTNCKSLEASLNSDETDDWLGKRIVLHPVMVDFQGRQVEAIRVHEKKTKMLAKEGPTTIGRAKSKPSISDKIQPMTQAEIDDEGDDIPY